MYIYNKIDTSLLDAIIEREKEFVDMWRGKDDYIIVFKNEEGQYYLDTCREFVSLNVGDITKIQGIKLITDAKRIVEGHETAFY